MKSTTEKFLIAWFFVALFVIGFMIKPVINRSTKAIKIAKTVEPVLTELAVKDFGPPKTWRGVVMRERSVNVLGNLAIVFVESPLDSKDRFSGFPVLLDENGGTGRNAVNSSILGGREIYFQVFNVEGNPAYPTSVGSDTEFSAMGVQVPLYQRPEIFVANPKPQPKK